MCLIVFGYRTIPGYKLVFAANRDEFYNRPTRPAGFWKDNRGMLAGKDLKAGGTWLGIHKNSRFGALTNYRDMKSHNPDARSRGHLVTQYLNGNQSAVQFLDQIDDEAYNGFNLLLGDMNSFWHYSNQTGEPIEIEPGIHGISNALLNTPWPKVESSKSRFRELVEEDELTTENLFGLLRNSDTYPEDSLPETGLSPELEKAVSATFIRTEKYGTRCSTLLFIRDDHSVRFVERTYQPGSTEVAQENGYEFKAEPAGRTL